MIRTSGNIIALTTLISGVHCHFINYNEAEDDIDVTIKAGEGHGTAIQLTSGVCKYRLTVSLTDDWLHVDVWDVDGVRVHEIRCDGAAPQPRASLRKEVIKILKGETVFE